MIKGKWQIIQWCPDIVTQEWLNIGVGFYSEEGQHFKFLDHFKKIECAYGVDMAKHADEVIKLTKQFFHKKCYEFSPQIRLIEVGLKKGQSVEDNLNSSYERVVSLRAS